MTCFDAQSGDVSHEQQIAELRRQLLEAQKLTALGELVGTTTHEFNNILMTIMNYAKMGLRHRDDATRDKALTKILTASERAARITNSVLGMARNRSSSMEPTDIASLIRETLVLLEREMARYRISVDVDVSDTPPAQANGNQIQQVLFNLLINARQAIGESGEIMVRLAHDSVSNTVDLMVRDNGAGIPQDKLRRIFEPFFSTKEGPDQSGKGGTGLGLSACREIIESHNGRIRVDSTVGRGTQFTIKLPAVTSATPNPPSTPTTTTQMSDVASPDTPALG